MEIIFYDENLDYILYINDNPVRVGTHCHPSTLDKHNRRYN